jgi:hypothetical protein
VTSSAPMPIRRCPDCLNYPFLPDPQVPIYDGVTV